MNETLAKYRKLVEGYKWSEQFVNWSLITIASACLERRVWINEHGLGYRYPTIYVVFVGPPAVKKTSSAKCPINLFLRDWADGPIRLSDQLTPAALVKELREANEMRGYQWGTSPLFAFTGEKDIMTRDIGGGSLLDMLTDFYDSRYPGEVWQKHTHKHGKEPIVNPALTLLTCTTPTSLQASNVGASANWGFTRRVVFVTEPYYIEGVEEAPPIDYKLTLEIKAEIERLAKLRGEFVIMNGAKAELSRIFHASNAWARENASSTIMGSYMAVKRDHVKQIAMILSALRDSERIIKGEDVIEADALLTRAEQTLMDAFGTRITYRDEALGNKIMARLKPGQAMNEEQFLKSFHQDGQLLPMGHEFLDVIQSLTRSGNFKIESTPEGVVYRRLK